MTTDPIAVHVLAAHRQSPVLMALFDADDVLRHANPAFCRAYAVEPDGRVTWTDMMRANHASGRGALIVTDDIEAWLVSARSRRGKQTFRAFEADLCDGRWIWMTETLCVDGWMLCLANDITLLRTSERAVRQQRDQALRAAYTDPLTGISSRVHVMKQLDERLQSLRADGMPCGLVLMDLDHFKRINDTWGHVAGDCVLQDFARTVHGLLRREDGFGRLGGEEFMLLLPGVTPVSLEQAVRRILQEVRVRRPLPDVAALRYTCSAGMTMLRVDDDVRAAYQRIDEALYLAKGAGRDRACWSDG